MGSSSGQIQLINTCKKRVPYTIDQVLFLLGPRPRAVRFCRRAQAVAIRCRVARYNFPSRGRRRHRRGEDRHADGCQRSNPMTMLVLHTFGGVTWDSCLSVYHTPFHAHCVHVSAHNVKYRRYTVVPRWLAACHHVALSALLAVDHVHCEHRPAGINVVPMTEWPNVHCMDTNPCKCISCVASTRSSCFAKLNHHGGSAHQRVRPCARLTSVSRRLTLATRGQRAR